LLTDPADVAEDFLTALFVVLHKRSRGSARPFRFE
jgi:hypothetical protein